MKLKTTIAAAAVAALAIPATASAHVFIEQGEQPADGYPLMDVIVPHGCEDSATTSVTVSIPKDVPTVTPQRNPFWTISTKEGPKDEVELFGETITEGVSEVTWTAKEPLPHDQLDVLGLEAKLPAAEGETVYFPTIQKCEKGQTAWIQIPEEGQTEEDLESPAPAVTLTAAEGEHGGSDVSAAGDDAATESESADDGDDGDFASKDMGIAALVLGGLGLVAGGAGLARSRKQ